MFDGYSSRRSAEDQWGVKKERGGRSSVKVHSVSSADLGCIWGDWEGKETTVAINILANSPPSLHPSLSTPMVVCLSFPPSRRFPDRLRACPISHCTALWLACVSGRNSTSSTWDTLNNRTHAQHFGKQAPLFPPAFFFWSNETTR